MQRWLVEKNPNKGVKRPWIVRSEDGIVMERLELRSTAIATVADHNAGLDPAVAELRRHLKQAEMRAIRAEQRRLDLATPAE